MRIFHALINIAFQSKNDKPINYKFCTDRIEKFSSFLFVQSAIYIQNALASIVVKPIVINALS